MISFGKYQYSRVEGDVTLYNVEGVCLSSDAKPTAGIENGSQMMEMDTGKLFFYDKAGNTWREWK